ncbi:hypothetical protein [Faecalibaculum rodentium]|uniref:hypothetical protein n=1 Tax=Faecalibaculum rodentium TaxID=1702221 RepID=UPI0023F129D2|nr:hypothetical protein [Faecalibaculum rodentium]
MTRRKEQQLMILKAAADGWKTGELKEEDKAVLEEQKEMIELGACLLRICERSKGNTEPHLNIPVDKGTAHIWQKVLACYKSQGKDLEELIDDISFAYALLYLTEADSDCTALYA